MKDLTLSTSFRLRPPDFSQAEEASIFQGRKKIKELRERFHEIYSCTSYVHERQEIKTARENYVNSKEQMKLDRNKGPSQIKVLTWIKKKEIFSRKYVFVPIVCWRHWSLLILYHFGESFRSRTTRPCMLLLDSLEKSNPRSLEPYITKFVSDIYNSEGCEDNEHSISKIPLLVPKVLQQKNGEDCGIFVLYFIHLFMLSALEAFHQEDYPYFLTESWFTLADMEIFHKDIIHFACRCNFYSRFIMFSCLCL
ncbi:unnamed protein product [Spirodela intermedia]|uniref:Ubiquitin-like protease family profile domain-containing protein n=1 Tax=Spirodela intermedia TaxID=51605 RepID=A0A7I8KSX2_SPIIN|nr:unnamed protein product [Spirodela intermedia]